jgi:hypothetical protein
MTSETRSPIHRSRREVVEKSVAAFADWVSRSHQRTEPAGNVQVLDASEVGMDGGNWGLSTSKSGKLLGNWCSFLVGLGQIYIYIIVTNGGYGHRVVWYMWYTFRWPGDCWKLMVQDMAPRICRIMSDLIQWIVHSYVHSIVKCHSLISWKSIKPCYFAISISSFPTSNTARSQRIVQSNIINGNFRILKWRYLPYIYIRPIWGLCKGISPQNMALYGTVPLI